MANPRGEGPSAEDIETFRSLAAKHVNNKGEPISTEIARIMGRSRSTVQGWRRYLDREPNAGPVKVRSDPKPVNQDAERQKLPVFSPAQPKDSQVFLLTAAQDQTEVHQPFLENLKAYAAHRNAQILIGGFTYQKGLFEDHSVDAGIFDQAVVPFLQPTVIDLVPRALTWFGKANILPTASDPLSGWDTQTREAWTIMPHAKIALKTIPTMPGRRPKQIMSTGVVTKENYVQRNAGQKAEFHHTIGATVVEVSSDGAFFCRQISADRDGGFQDLDIRVRHGRVSIGHRIESITFGDVHTEVIDPLMARHAWGFAPGDVRAMDGNMLDALRPLTWFVHDSYDFTARSHHTRNDPHERARLLHNGHDSVRDGIRLASILLGQIRRDFGQLIHVASNHNMHMDGWLKDTKAAGDPVNAGYWHRLNAIWHEAIEQGAGGRFLIHEEALRAESFDRLDGVRFLHEGESFSICQGVAPIECGLHSHVGPRGARGSLTNLANVVERVNIAHGHAPGIKNGAYRAGTLGRRDLLFATKGPGDWQPASILTYETGKRTIVTHWDDGRWRL